MASIKRLNYLKDYLFYAKRYVDYKDMRDASSVLMNELTDNYAWGSKIEKIRFKRFKCKGAIECVRTYIKSHEDEISRTTIFSPKQLLRILNDRG